MVNGYVNIVGELAEFITSLTTNKTLIKGSYEYAKTLLNLNKPVICTFDSTIAGYRSTPYIGIVLRNTSKPQILINFSIESNIYNVAITNDDMVTGTLTV